MRLSESDVGVGLMDYLTKEERLQLQSMKEDYLFILTDLVYLRDEDPEFYNSVVDQWESIKFRLEDDEHRRIMDKCTTHILDEDGNLTKKE